MATRVQLPQVFNKADNAMPGSASALNVSTPATIGVLVTDAENFRPHGVQSEIEKNETDWCGCCGWPLIGRMIISTSSMAALFFVVSASRVLYPQGNVFHNFIAAFTTFATVFPIVFMFSYADGATLSFLGSLIVTLSNWVLRAIFAAYPGGDKHDAEYHQLKGINYWYDAMRTITVWISQLLGAYIGVLLAILWFLQGQNNEFYTIANLMTPKFGVATWLPGSLQLTSWQVSCMNFVGSFIIHSAILITFATDLTKKKVWGALYRAFAYLLTFTLLYSHTGAAVDWLMWFVPASLTFGHFGYPSSDVTISYVLVPILGAVAAALFFWFIVFIVKSTRLDQDPSVIKKPLVSQAPVQVNGAELRQRVGFVLGQGVGQNVAVHTH